MARAHWSPRRIERRKHWRDRRHLADRRNATRNQHENYECRTGAPRRQSDVAGELYDGDIWWNKATPLS